MRVAIIGGGIAGVSAAWEFARSKASIEVTLFEATNRLGGIVETVREQGFIIECGPDAWVTEKPWARQLAEELGLQSEILSSNDATRKTYILRDESLQAIPDGMRMMVPSDLDALDRSPLFSDAAKLQYREEIDRAEELRTTAPLDDESVASFVRRHFGSEVLETIGAPLLSGVFGGDVTTLSARAVMAPFVAMEREHGSLIAAVQARAKAGTMPVFTTLRTGLGTLIDAMATQIPSSWIRMESPIVSLKRHTEGWTLNTARDQQEFDVILIATPAQIASDLLFETDRQAAKLMQTDASSAVVAAFGFMEPIELPPGFGFLIPPNRGGVDSLLAATFVDQKFHGRVPHGGRLMRAFFGGHAGARLLSAEDETIVPMAFSQLESILGSLPKPVVTVVRRWPRSLPQYSVGHLERMKKLDDRVRSIGQLWLLGNGYRGVGLPDLVRDSRLAVQKLVGEAGLRESMRS